LSDKTSFCCCQSRYRTEFQLAIRLYAKESQPRGIIDFTDIPKYGCCVAELHHEDRIHDSLDKDTLDRRPVEPKPAPSATIISLPPAWPPRATVRAGFSRRVELKEELWNRKRCQGYR
jgi:hypothetical protein